MLAALLVAVFVAGLWGAPGCRPAAAKTPLSPIRLAIVASADVHGRLVAARHADPATGQVREQGGLALLGGYLRILRRKEQGRVLLLDGGDILQGTLASNHERGAAMIEGYNALGYHAAAVGNHEFDFGPKVLRDRVRQARFPILGRNIYLRGGGRVPWLPGQGTALVELGPTGAAGARVKVGIIGLITPTTPQVSIPANVKDFEFRPLVPEVESGARELRARGAQVVVVVMHAGGHCTRFDDPDRLDSCEADAESFQLARALRPGTVDAIFGGHTHAPTGHRVNGTWVMQPGSLGQAFSLLELRLHPRTGRPIDRLTRATAAVPVVAPAQFRGEKVEPDERVAAVLSPYLERVRKFSATPLGVVVTAALPHSYRRESPLGSLLADLLRQLTGADIGLVNSGGVRADLPAGPLTYGAFYQVYPFDNAVATLTLNGTELEALIGAAVAGRFGLPQVSGLRARVVRCGPQRRLAALVDERGRRLEPTRLYRVVTSDFVARGGDAYGAVLRRIPRERIDLGEQRALNLRESLVDLLRRRGGRLDPPRSGRIRIDADPTCTRAPAQAGAEAAPAP